LREKIGSLQMIRNPRGAIRKSDSGVRPDDIRHCAPVLRRPAPCLRCICGVSFEIKNTGKVTASEVAQVYVAPQNPSIIRPSHELKGYAKVKLAPGKSQTVTISLPASAFSYYDVRIHDWKVDNVEYMIQVGSSEQDIKLESKSFQSVLLK